MDFNFRQYDPQLGRFNAVDPLAASAGQDMISPYAAMGNAPESLTDPTGLRAGPAPKFITAGAMASAFDNNIDKSYAIMLQMNAEAERLGMGSLSDIGSGLGGGGGSSDQSGYISEDQINAFLATTGGSNVMVSGNGSISYFTTNFGGAAPGGVDGGATENDDGGHDYRIKRNGRIKDMGENGSDDDVLMTRNGKHSMTLPVGILNKMTYTSGRKRFYRFEFGANYEKADEMFYFTMAHTDVEWGLIKYGLNNGHKNSYLVTSFDGGTNPYAGALAYSAAKQYADKLSYFYFAHNHPELMSAGRMSRADANNFQAIYNNYDNASLIIYYLFIPYQKHPPFIEGQ